MITTIFAAAFHVRPMSCSGATPASGKIGGKVFAIGGWFEGPEFAVTFKCSEMSFAILRELPGLRPAPYLASRGLTWVQRVDARSLSNHDLKQYIRQSYAIILAALPKKTQEALKGRI